MFSPLYARTMLILSNDFLDNFVLFWECPFVNSAKGRFNYVASCDFPEFLSHFSRMFKGGGNNRPLSKIHSVWFCKIFCETKVIQNFSSNKVALSDEFWFNIKEHMTSDVPTLIRYFYYTIYLSLFSKIRCSLTYLPTLKIRCHVWMLPYLCIKKGLLKVK